MLNTPLIYRQLTPQLQQRLAQLALLQQRAAVLARMPALTLTKGKAVRWAATPAPLLLRQVMALAALDGQPRLSALLLRNWFQHKPELCVLVRQALLAHSYLVPALGVLPQPAATVLRLAPRDLGPGADSRLFTPAGASLPGTDASPEEVTLMAELLGWCARRPGPDELAGDDERIAYLKLAYRSSNYFEDMIADVLAVLPPTAPAAQLAAHGELPAEVDATTEKALNWAERYRLFLPLRNSLHALTSQPGGPDPEPPIRRADLEEALLTAEAITRSVIFRDDARHWALDALAEVGRVWHQQQADFVPLAAVHALARALAARITAESDEPGEDLPTLMLEMHPLLALLDWIRVPSRLAELDPQDEILQQFEAAVPPAVFNALLLRKLKIAEVAAE